MTATATWSELRIPRQALKALADVPKLNCGPLSPLLRIAAPGVAAPAGLQAALQRLAPEWEAAIPALLHPQRLVGFLVGDGETQVVGQYVWADELAIQPGFKVSAEGSDVRLIGPLSSADVASGFLELLSLGTVAEREPLRLSLTPEQFWTFAALADTYQIANHLRRAARASGPAVSFRLADITATWQAGLERPNAGWAVSVFASLVPDRVPANFAAQLPRVLDELIEVGQLFRLEADTDDPLGDMYLLGAELETLFQGLAVSAVHFGFSLQTEHEPNKIESTLLGGWRSPGGLLIADLAGFSSGAVELLLSGPTHLMEFIDEIMLGTFEGQELPAIMGPTRDQLLAMLQQDLGKTVTYEAPRPAGLAANTCARCGGAVHAGARFCGACGTPLAR